MPIDFKESTQLTVSLEYDKYTADAAGEAVNVDGFESVLCIINCGAWTDGSMVASIEHSPDGVNETFVACVNGETCDGASVNYESDNYNGRVFIIWYTGGLPYVRIVLTEGDGVTDGSAIGGHVLALNYKYGKV